MNFINLLFLVVGIIIGLLLAYKIIPLFVDRTEFIYTHGFMGNVTYPSWFKKKFKKPIFTDYFTGESDNYPKETFLTK